MNVRKNFQRIDEIYKANGLRPSKNLDNKTYSLGGTLYGRNIPIKNKKQENKSILRFEAIQR